MNESFKRLEQTVSKWGDGDRSSMPMNGGPGTRTIVTPGWLERLIRHCRRDSSIDAVAAVTKFSKDDYENVLEMQTFALGIAKDKFEQASNEPAAALDCVLVLRSAWDKVAGFEGIRIVTAEDTFIHRFENGSPAEFIRVGSIIGRRPEFKLKLSKLHPSTCYAREGFQVQPTGQSAMGVECENATPGTAIVRGSTILASWYQTPLGNQRTDSAGALRIARCSRHLFDERLRRIGPSTVHRGHSTAAYKHGLAVPISP